MKYLIIGAGFSGAVIAERLSQNPNNKIVIIDERNHIGGNCYTERDKDTNIMVHKYGPHIFHTNDKEVWDYIQQFCEMQPFVNRVKSVYNGQIYSMPINLHTINQFFGKNLNPKEAKEFLFSLAVPIENPQNLEEQAISLIGKELYKAFFYGYTKKQWGCDPSKLPADILKRLPIRFNYNDNYYRDFYQGIPKEGYTFIFDKMLNRSNIEIQLNKRFDVSWNRLSDYNHIFYTGSIDSYFNYKYGKLSYRTVFFEKKTNDGDYQGNAVINYAESEVPYTRIHEHKHFTPWENHKKTIYFKEFSKETTENDIPYYPKRLKSDMDKYILYKKEADKLEKVTFLGRLATYRYMDMHQVIKEALDIAKKELSR